MSQKIVSPGQFLVAARDALALTQEEIAKKLRLSITLIRDLEQDNYVSIGARTYVRGYLCSYARVVGVSDAKITELLDNSGLISVVSQPAASITVGAPVRNVTGQTLRFKLPQWEIMACSAGVLLLIITLIVGLSTPTPTPTPTSTVVKKAVIPAVTSAAMPAATLAAPVVVTQSPPAAIAQPAVQTVAEPVVQPAVQPITETNPPFKKKHRRKKVSEPHVTYTIRPAQ